MLNFTTVLITSENPKELAAFYEKVFGTKPVWSGGDWVGYAIGNGMIGFGPHDKVKGKATQPERIMINFETADVQAEFDRIKGLGATVVAVPYHPGEEPTIWLATLADPDGNYFQLMTPMSGK